ncbi:carbonic anhydrase-like [Mercenaria mercenaria]|uniref:carbonic anhydrase-like n=1 Tax=Mercenaria mercenaria TaxID=6596 RepID=UPI00234F8CBA|nr:carbonic anhydrase-like [Mercenaria mercenaria]
MTTIAIRNVGVIFLNLLVQNINGHPQQHSVLRESITDVAHWNYGDGEYGPPFWPYLFPQYCAGMYQSPIDIHRKQTIYDPALTEFAIFSDPPRRGSMFQVHNNGHAVEINTVGEFFVTNGGLPGVYKTEQFHFHWGAYNNRGSEHTIDGERAPLEMHIVSCNRKYGSANEAAKHPDGIAVLSVLFRISLEDNPVLQPIIDVLPKVRDPDDHRLITVPPTAIKKLLPNGRDRYFRYQGSLTTPNCSEAVIWTVFEQKQFISERQLYYFRQMLTSSLHVETRAHRQFNIVQPDRAIETRIPLVDNFRPIQRLNGRRVYRSFKNFNYHNIIPCLKPLKYLPDYIAMPQPHYLPHLHFSY